MNLREETFVREYLIDLDGQAAAIRAGFSGAGAKSTASRLIRRPHIAAAIQAGMDRRARKLDLTADRTLLELSRMAFYDPADFATDDVEVRSPADIKRLPEDVRRAIVGWGWDKAGNFTIKLADKLGALDRIGRHQKLFTDKVEHTGKDGEPIAVVGVTLAEVIAARAAIVDEC